MEADYLKRTVGSYLGEGLAEVASKRPSDPIEYLALWLLKQKQNIISREVNKSTRCVLSRQVQSRSKLLAVRSSSVHVSN